MQYNNHSSICYSVSWIPPTNYILTLVNVIPLLETGAFDLTRDLFQHVDDEKHQKNRCINVPFMLLAAILAQWLCPVASSEALDLLHWEICAKLYRCTAAPIKMAGFVCVFIDCCLFACCPDGRWGNMKWVVTRWRCPVASRVALDMPHWAVPSVLLRRTTMAIKMAGGWGTFTHCCLLFP